MPDDAVSDTTDLHFLTISEAASLIERMEQDGVISSPNHKGVREVLLPDHER